MSRERFDELRGRLAEIADLGKTASLLSWDQHVMMPPRGAAIRAEQMATVGRIAHEKFISPEIGRRIDGLRGWGEEQDYDSLEASLIRVVVRDWEKACRVPPDLRAEISRSAALANPVWVDARKNNDFASFLPVLRKNLDLRKRYIDCFEVDDEPYDIVLDDYERGMRTKEVRRIFDYLKEHQAPLVQEVAAQGGNEPRDHAFPIEQQKVFELEVARAFGFTDDAWRLDPTVHPFASGTGITDIRITTRYFTDHLGGLFGTMHEFGHGLYEHQIDPALERTPLARGVSLGMHESQSRMWENLVGRSLPFWRHFFPRLQELYPDTLGGYDLERWYREVNVVEPSLIRVEADEATYNLHIILRFELEQAMLADEFPLEQLPDEWNSRVWDYLGISVPDDTEGVLQDVHWSGGSIGYFPTYALGNLISAQIWERVVTDVPDLDESFERGEFAPLRDWLREHLHRHGRKYTPGETLERVVGTSQIDPAPYMRYLREKLAAIYGIPAAAA
jgi:carboxypeptidase Taq